MNIFVLFPVDLYNDITILKNSKVYLVEESHYFDRSDDKIKFNILKPIYHRATMKAYYDYLKSKNINCQYIDVNKDWIKIVKSSLKNNILNFYDPVDRYIEKKIYKNFETYDIINSQRFILTIEEMESYEGVLRQTSFYQWIRKFKNILIDSDDKPYGGKLTYDSENRKKPYKGIESDVDSEDDYMDNKYVIEATKYIKNIYDSNNHTYISDIILKFPIDRKGAFKSLHYFIKHNLFRFGDYQDVILSNETNSFVFHSALSPMLNIGLITPDEVIENIMICFDNLTKNEKKKKINDVEGFIRQILGWREFSRYMYEYHSDKYLNKNFFKATKLLSNKWYDGTTGIAPLDNCIIKAFKFGYLHHIERLMVVANYMTLSGIKPLKMYKWFMEFSLDSYDWVMEYNIYCMASYSDGGQFTSKPYISSSAYILKMSNYDKSGIWLEKWNKLFWDFLAKHKNKIKKIGRLSMLLKYLK
jgi:deoxyribodipyrimidine photolyase-related protein